MAETLTPAGLRQRALARASSARCAGAPRAATSGPGATRCSAEAGRQTAGAACAPSYVAGLPRDARRRLHGGRRVPLPRPRRGARRRRGRRRGRHRARAPARRLRRGGLDALPPGVGRRVPRARSRSSASAGVARRPRPPLRARLPARLARGDRALRGSRGRCRCTCTPTSSRARSRSASPSTASGRSSCSRETGCLGPRTTVVHATHADDARARPARRGRRARLRLPDDRGEPRRRLRARSSALCERGIALCIGSDSNVRIDPLEELRELEGIARRRAGSATSSRSTTLLCFGADEGAAALGLERVARRRGRPRAPVARGRRRATCRAALVFGCAADVFA